MADVFISYASEDRERVRPLAEALAGRGLSVWWDRALVAGDDYARVIERELAAAKAVIVTWTHASIESDFVRDEAGRAREAGRLVPVTLDRGVTPPLGFGHIHVEDISAWNGAAAAREMDVVEAAVRARVEGRAVDAAAVQSARRARKRIPPATVLGAAAALLLIVAGVYVVATQVDSQEAAPMSRQDQLAQLLDLVADGRITGDQAVELARLLQDSAFADAAADFEAGDVDAGRVVPALRDAPRVARAEAMTAARASFVDAAATLLQDPDKRVRDAVTKVREPQSRREALDEMWAIAREGGASAAPIWRACGALMLATGDDRAARALENARALNPQDKALWRMLSFAYAKQKRPSEAAAAAFVAAGLDAAFVNNWSGAVERLEKALPLMADAPTRGFVLGQVGDAAAASEDWQRAEESYRAALSVHSEQKNIAAISMDSSKLARSQMKQGDMRRACVTLRRARQAGAAVTVEEFDSACAVRAGPQAVTPPE